MPATCTCTCETKPVMDEETPTSAVANPTYGNYETGASQSDDPSLEWQTQFNSDWMDAVPDNEEESQDNGSDMAPISAAHGSDVHDNKIPEVVEQYQEGWGHASRFPWKRLPDIICYRDQCRSDADCCLRYNICDRSAKVCVDCWYGAACTSEKDCCNKYPHCQRATYRANIAQGAGTKDVTVGKCVDTI